jgi:hypothetical protein
MATGWRRLRPAEANQDEDEGVGMPASTPARSGDRHHRGGISTRRSITIRIRTRSAPMTHHWDTATVNPASESCARTVARRAGSSAQFGFLPQPTAVRASIKLTA